MDSYLYQKMCKEYLIELYKNKFDIELIIEDIFVTWSCKTLQNNKVLLSTNVGDGSYFEFTYNGDKKEIYVDMYKKELNKVIEVK